MHRGAYSASCISGGFTISEVTKLFYEAGLQLGGAGLLASVDVCEYNPCVEDWRTGIPLVRHRIQKTEFEDNIDVWYELHDGHSNCIETINDN